MRMRKHSVICERYAVVVLPFPFTEIPAVKRRPAVVISSSAFNRENGSSLVAMITSSTKKDWPSDVVIEDRQSAGLNVACRVRWRLATVPNDLIAKSIGSLTGMDRIRCEREFAKMVS